MQEIKKAKHEPSRMCVSCRVRNKKTDLIRIVRVKDKYNPGGFFIKLDKSQKSEGRGAYLCYNLVCLKKLKKMKSKSKSFVGKLSEDAYKDLEEIIGSFEG